MIDYVQWIEEYEETAFIVLITIKEKKQQLQRATSKDSADQLRISIKMYQEVYKELLAVVRLLSKRVSRS